MKPARGADGAGAFRRRLRWLVAAGLVLLARAPALNEVAGESDPAAKLIDFAHPERNQFHAINQFRIDTPGCVKSYTP